MIFTTNAAQYLKNYKLNALATNNTIFLTENSISNLIFIYYELHLSFSGNFS